MPKPRRLLAKDMLSSAVCEKALPTVHQASGRLGQCELVQSQSWRERPSSQQFEELIWV